MFSIVIPCRNEASFIAECLDSILSNGYPLDKLEIIIADGNSTDESLSIIEEYAQNNACIKWLKNEKQFTPFGLNLGIRESTGDYVMILGAHASLDHGYLQKCVELFRAIPEASCIGGYVNHIPENPLSSAIAKAMSHPFGVGNAHFRTGRHEGFVDTVAFGTYRKEVFEITGLFDEDLVRNQDDEFSFRMLQKGMKIFLSSKLTSRYIVRSSYSKLFRQYYQYGYWKVFVNRKHKTLTTVRQIIPAAFVSFLFVGFLLSIALPALFWFYGAALLVYLTTSILVSISISKNVREFRRLPLVFFILHFSYGRGYLAGIYRFLIAGLKPADKQENLTR